MEGTLMNRTCWTSIALLTAALSAPAFAADVHDTAVVGAGEIGVRFDVLDARAASAPRARADVVDELRAARRSGALAAAGELGLAPIAFASPVVAAKTRAQVRAEYDDAVRSGDIAVGGEFGRKANELTPQRYRKAG
jgi:hypothetical protein